MEKKEDKGMDMGIWFFLIVVLCGVVAGKALDAKVKEGSTRVIAESGPGTTQEYEIRQQLPNPEQNMSDWCEKKEEVGGWLCEEFSGVIYNARKHDAVTLVSVIEEEKYYVVTKNRKTSFKEGVVYNQVSVRNGFVTSMLIDGEDRKLGEYIQGR